MRLRYTESISPKAAEQIKKHAEEINNKSDLDWQYIDTWNKISIFVNQVWANCKKFLPKISKAFVLRSSISYNWQVIAASYSSLLFAVRD